MIEKTVVIVKPDGVGKNLTGEIIGRFEKEGFKLMALKMMKADKKLIKKHYPNTMAKTIGEKSKAAGEKIIDVEAHGKKVLEWLRDYMTEGPVVPMIIEGADCIQKVRNIVGYTDPSKAEKGTIRGDFGTDSILKANQEKRPVRNLVHASGNREEAEKEIKLWFRPEEIMG